MSNYVCKSAGLKATAILNRYSEIILFTRFKKLYERRECNSHHKFIETEPKTVEYKQ